MLIYHVQSLCAVTIFALVHLFASSARRLNTTFHRRFLSVGSGVAIAYVFVDILPKLSLYAPTINEAVWRVFPYFEKHVYVMALLGFLLFFMVDHSSKAATDSAAKFYFSLSSYALLNILIGYAVADIDNPEVKPLALFTIAISVHYFVNDYSLTESFYYRYNHLAKWVLVFCLFLGWTVGLFFELPATPVSLISAFIAGGIIMNVTRHELPERHDTSMPSFLIAALGYTMVLLLLK